MPGEFRVVYPLESFDGGFNNKFAPNYILDSEAQSCANVVFDDFGGVATRSGTSQLNTTAVGSFSGDGLFTVRFNDATEKMIGVWNGTAYQLGTTTFTTIASAQSIWTAGNRVDMAMYQNLAFFGASGNRPYKYNGTEWTRMGITQPNSSPTAASGVSQVSGVSTGDVNYKVSYVNSYVVEGDVSGASTTLTVSTTATVSITSIPVAPTSFGVAARKLYRKDVSTAGLYKLVTTINDNTTTTYTDTTVGSALGATAPTDQGEPPNFSGIVVHQERLWFILPQSSYLYYSELTNPFVVKTTNFILIGDGDGETCTALSVHQNQTVVGKKNSVWAIYQYDTTPGNWIRIKVNSKYGISNQFCQARYDKNILYLSELYNKVIGFTALTGAQTQPDQVSELASDVFLDTLSDKIEPDIFLLNYAAISKATAINYKNKIWIAVPTGSNVVNNKVYQFDYHRRDISKITGSFVPFTYPFGFASFAIYGGSLYGQAATANGLVYKLDTNGFSDISTAINSFYEGKEFHGYDEHQENWKDFRVANFIVGPLGSYLMNISYIIDAETSSTQINQVNLTPTGNLWGSFNWGGNWGGGNTRKQATIYLGRHNGKRIQFKFDNQNTAGQGFKVYPNGSFSYNLRGKR